jgi:hypothetical protein
MQFTPPPRQVRPRRQRQPLPGPLPDQSHPLESHPKIMPDRRSFHPSYLDNRSNDHPRSLHENYRLGHPDNIASQHILQKSLLHLKKSTSPWRFRTSWGKKRSPSQGVHSNWLRHGRSWFEIRLNLSLHILLFFLFVSYFSVVIRLLFLCSVSYFSVRLLFLCSVSYFSVRLLFLCSGPPPISLFISSSYFSVQVRLLFLCSGPSPISLFRSVSYLSVQVRLLFLCSGPPPFSVFRSASYFSLSVRLLFLPLIPLLFLPFCPPPISPFKLLSYFSPLITLLFLPSNYSPISPF